MLLQDFGISQPNVIAACQQLALCAGVYQNDRANVEALLGADGEVLLWRQREGTWPPSYAFIKTSDGRYFVIIEGTTNTPQAIIHLWGSFYIRDELGGANVNGLWWINYKGLLEEVKTILPHNLPSGKLHVSGHSYGGALAHIAALDLGRSVGMQGIQLITFGEPKAITAGAVPGLPVCHWRYVSDLDPVPKLPLDETLYPGNFDPLDPRTWSYETLTWEHLGDVQVLGPGGAINTPEPPPDPYPPGVADNPVEQHFLGNYSARFRLWNNRFGV